MRQVQKHLAAVVIMPGHIRPRHRFWRRAAVVMLDQAIVWRWSPEALAVELAGWAVDGRLQAAGFGSDRYRERRERRILLEKIGLGGSLLGAKEAAATLQAQARREYAGEGPAPAAT